MKDVDPDLVIADVFLPGGGGLDLCRHIKNFHRHVRVILTAGLLEPLDTDEARKAGCDAVLRKPFEASVVMETIRPLVQEARLARGLFSELWRPRSRSGFRCAGDRSSRASSSSRSGTRPGGHHIGAGCSAPEPGA